MLSGVGVVDIIISQILTLAQELGMRAPNPAWLWDLHVCLPWRPQAGHLTRICPSLGMLYTQQQYVESDLFFFFT